MKVNLSNKIIVVTGAASGIGAAIARLAAESEAGALFLTDRNGDGCRAKAEELASEGATVAVAQADLSEPSAPAAIARAAVARFGRIDGLVNAAGLTTRASFRDGTPDLWEELFAVNARAPFFLMQEAIADLTSRRAAGAIVNILSINAHCGAPDLAIYSATKGALATLTKNAANAYMRDRVRVNGINLGWADTEAERRMQAETLGFGSGWIEAASAHMPLGRLLEPAEVARLAVFLLSDASAPLSGAVIDLEQKVAGGIGHGASSGPEGRAP